MTIIRGFVFAGRWMEAFKQKNMEDGVNASFQSLLLYIYWNIKEGRNA